MSKKYESEDLLRLLLRRSALLRALASESRDKRVLAEDLDISRSTVDRALRELTTAQFVTYRDGVYTITLTGQCVLDAFDNCKETFNGVMDAQELLMMLPADAPVAPAFLRDASIYTSTPDIPDGVINELFESVEQADYLYGIAPVALAGQLRAFYDAANAGGTYVEMIIDDELFDNLLRSPDSRQVMVDAIRRERTNIYLADIPFGYGLWAVDDEAGMVVYTDTGVGGIALNDTDEAVSWAKSKFGELHDDSNLMTLSSIGEESSGDS